MWAAAGNRFLTDTLDMLYAQSDRLWHLYLADVADTRSRGRRAPRRSSPRSSTATASAPPSSLEAHVRAFDDKIGDAVTRRLGPPSPAPETPPFCLLQIAVGSSEADSSVGSGSGGGVSRGGFGRVGSRSGL